MENMKIDLEKLVIRAMCEKDAEIIAASFKEQGWHKPKSQFDKYLKWQKEGKRAILIGELEGAFAGYLTINWQSDYKPFKDKSIPEIVDFNVLKKYQRRGIGTALMDEAEKRIKRISKYAGIGFGVTRDYGPAQILYINRNYKPDSNGLVKDSKSLKNGDLVTINDDIVLYLVKAV
jgi:ribosomal protein S18 acetylase RimI-like enzyme